MMLIGKLLIIAALVLLNGFFVAAEFALVKIRISHIQTLTGKDSKRAAIVRQIKEELNAYLSACQVGITMASLGLGWLGEPFLARALQPFFSLAGIESATVIKSISFTLAFSAITFLHIVVGEQAPKNSGHPQGHACRAICQCSAAIVLYVVQTGDLVPKRGKQLGASANSSRGTHCRRRIGA